MVLDLASIDWIPFIFGFFGAFAVELYRFWKLRNDPLPPMPRHYYFLSIAFFVLGGIVALILQATTLYAAFYVGASTPAILSTIAGSPPPIQPPTVPTKGPAATTHAIPHRTSPMTIREYLGVL